MVTRLRDMLERSRKSLLDPATKQRWEGSTRQWLQRSRETVSQLVGSPTARETGSQEVLAGVCSSVALRDLNLVDSLLEQLEQMESDEDDPDTLARLYKLDHLATRLRRNGENLRVLAGRDAGGSHAETSPLVDVIRAGMSSIEHYTRIELGKIATLGVVGFAADDVSRLLAELLDNATTHSPPNSAVTVSAHLTEQGSVMVRIEDSGIGLPAARLSALNERLASAPVLDRNAVQHMGLAVVRRLSARHNVRVWLARRAPHGTTASVLLPPALVQGTVASTRRRASPAGGAAADAGSKPRTSGVAAALQQARSRPGAESRGSIASGVGQESEMVSADSNGFPAQEPRAGKPEQHSTSTDSATTANGLPRRVPQSLKEPSITWPPPAPETDGSGGSGESDEQDQRAGHEQLLADLGAFAAGEQAAHAENQSRTDTAEGHDQ
ncbi:histidine kinase/DNA gyrase B/HSP90-like ATPase [Halopolyspora algeriensis]|uniref:histidine kinase n=1 Tax=Halopolyspora algeriensis TaxID=1500506 RepID=A0A368VH49_9ACTN|nr:ATP-binding protein [Halopolyspora algeriensis]RCW40443.1 histidine kinase/DNA gyrase B/HSP90-like ATPase [Halopolyspora algeriensis]TQM53726.1 histidine kinase/DNA gyrase B/HSP90-like ATPase [Halopolyspora algeriensis]